MVSFSVPGLLRSSPSRRLARICAAVVLGLVGGWLGLLLAGTVHHEVGPLTASVRVVPKWGGGTEVVIPPLGEMKLASHDGPLGLRATLEGVDVDEARRLVARPDRLASLGPEATADLRWAVEMAAVRALVVSLLGAAALSALATRRVGGTLLGAGTSVLAVGCALAVGVATWNPASLEEPRYTGLLTSAPTVVGDVESIVSNFSVYGDQLAQIVRNVSGLYAATSTLPLLPPQDDVVRVLHVSDLHLAPQAWDLIRTVAIQYKVDVVVDSGDLTDHGTRAENRYVEEIGHLGVPYVWVRGNHDSTLTEAAVRRVPDAVVLEGKPRTVAGLRFLGTGDPAFTPDKSSPVGEGADEVAAATAGLAETARARGDIDVAVFHDPAKAEYLDGAAKVALFGHLHYRKVQHGAAGTWLMVQGSTGGSGLRALEPEQPAPILLSVLYLDRTSHDLLAYDDIRLGGLGSASAEITRQVVGEHGDTTELAAPRSEQRSPEPTPAPAPAP